jgi:hypothetical protein
VEVVGWCGLVWVGEQVILCRLGCSGVVRGVWIVQGWWRRFCIATVLQLFGASSLRLWIDGVI